jgi:poly(hydroxyalkanoate) granule-associated protein
MASTKPISVTKSTRKTSMAVSKPRARATSKASTTTQPERGMTLKQITTKGRRKVSTAVHLTRDATLKLIDVQRVIWLAGLGALARVTATTGTKGERAFEALVQAGEKMEAQARDAIDANARLLKHRINGASDAVDHQIDTLSDAFDTRLKRALSRLGYSKRGVPAA